MSATVAHASVGQPPQWEAQHSGSTGRAVALVTTVDIGEGRTGKIEVYEGDDPFQAALEFCHRYGLPDSIVEPLAQHILDNMEQASDASTAEAPSSGGTAVDEHFLPPGVPVGGSYQQQQQQPSDESLERGLSAALQQALVHGEQQEVQQQGSRLERSHSLPADGPSRQDSPAGAQADVFAEAPITFRPASVNSAYGAEYFGSRSATSGGGSSSARSQQIGYFAHGSLPAHDRLYCDYFKKQKRLEEERRLRDLEIQLKTEQVHVTAVSQQLAAHRIKGTYSNYGERLYVEGRIEQMKKEQEAQQLREQEEQAELAELTFKPEISKLAKALKAMDQGVGAGAPAFQRLYYRGSTAKRQERMETIKREQEEAEVAECSFRPAINDRSVRMVAQRQAIMRDSGIAPYEQLYNDSIRRKHKHDQLAAVLPEEATFAPRINRTSVVLKRLMEGQQDGSDSGNSLLGSGNADVAERLLERGRCYQERLTAARETAQYRPVDPHTGRPLFQPETCRPPRYRRKPEGVPLGDYLYGIQAEWTEKAQAVRDATEQRARREASSSYVNQRSEQLVDRLKRERFRAIFVYLAHADERVQRINLLELVQDGEFMDTIDPEVRADIEYAARILNKALARRASEGSNEALQDSAGSRPTAATPLPPEQTGASSRLAAACASSMGGEVDLPRFLALMEEVLERTKGLSRQYLLPMPGSERRKFDEPSFRPEIDRNSQVIAARRRPDGLPAYEVLYETAKEIASKKEAMQLALEQKTLAECSFRPVLTAAPLAKEGRAMKLAGSAAGSKRGSQELELPASCQQPQGPEEALAQLEALEKHCDDTMAHLSLRDGQATAHENAQGQAQQQRLQDSWQLEREREQPRGENRAAPGGRHRMGAGAAVGNVRASYASIDLARAICSPSPTEECPAASEVAAGLGPPPKGPLSVSGPGYLGSSAAEHEVVAASSRDTTVEWVISEEHVVATIVGDDCQLAGLDLQSLAALPPSHPSPEHDSVAALQLSSEQQHRQQ